MRDPLTLPPDINFHVGRIFLQILVIELGEFRFELSHLNRVTKLAVILLQELFLELFTTWEQEANPPSLWSAQRPLTGFR